MRLTIPEIIRCTGGTLAGGNTGVVFTGVSTDSRSILEGELFVALIGERFDGHEFLGQAFARGAAGAVVMREGLTAPGPLFVVSDTLKALGDIAGFVRSRYDPAIAGITGSTGKTTTKELCASILSLAGPCLKTEKNFNNLIGVPLSLLKLTGDHAFAAIEMGTNSPGEIARLASLVRPRASILTNICPVHLSGLGSISGIVREKQAIFEHTEPGGIAVLDPGQEHMDLVAVPGSLRRITYSCGGRADVTLKEVLEQDLSGTGIVIDLAGREVRTRVGLPGMHNVSNALAAAACALGLGIDPEAVALGIRSARFPGMRSEVLSTGRISVIDDSYNANPASMKAALSLLSSSPHACRAAVLGDMLELGGESAHWHEEVGKWAALSGIGMLVVTGDMAQAMAKGALETGMDPANVHVARDIDDIIERLETLLDRDALVLVKASRGMHLDEVVSRIKAVA
ncbi:MAG: UDP-N-acetylmuramoyl-tripeptide--D-alanyl-D-alanine ligase [Desulfomonilia bacterium]|jgi:UDP-N-acetylmuramoyl-tripeptide--D-alanyl-D-alanine ligase